MKQKASTKSDDSKKTVPRVSIAPGNLAGVNNCCHTIQPQLPAQDKHVLRNPIIQPIFWGHYYVNNPSEVTNLTNLITDLVTGRFMNGLAQYGVVRGTVYGQQTVDIPPPNQGPAITSTVSPSHGGSDPVPGQISSWIANSQESAPSVNEQRLLYVVFLRTESTVPPNVGGWHSSTKYWSGPGESSADDLFYAVIATNGQTTPLANNGGISQVVGHELAEAFTDRDTDGFMKQTSCVYQGQNETDNCEIGDNCEQLGPFNYNVGTRSWQIEQYWSNWDNTCIHGDQPVSIRKFLQVIGVDGTQGLRQLNSSVININFVASKCDLQVKHWVC